MNFPNLKAGALGALAAALLASGVSGADMTTNHVAKSITLRATQEFQLRYLQFLPQGYEQDPGKKWPLILFLHGAGERGSDTWKAAVHGPPKYVKDHPELPFIIVTPQCDAEKRWENESLLLLLDHVMRELRVDPTRVYLTGLSMGGYGTWALGLAYPEKFAAMAPICGGGQTIDVLLAGRDKAQAMKTMGIWVFHGAKDPVVSVKESERMVDALKRAGITQAKFTVYPEAQHDSWTETYKNPDFYNWLLEHQRK